MRFENILRLLSHNHPQKATLSHRVYGVGDKRGMLPIKGGVYAVGKFFPEINFH